MLLTVDGSRLRQRGTVMPPTTRQPIRSHTEKPVPTSANRSILRYVVVGVFCTGVMVVVPWHTIWEQAHGRPMIDRQVYLEQVATGDLRSDYSQPDGVLSFITDEFLWAYLLNFLVRTVGLSIETAFIAISTFAVSAAVFLVLKKSGAIYLVLLLNPLFVDLTFSQLRIAFGMALLTWAYLLWARSRLLSALALLLACASHTAMTLMTAAFLGVALLGVRRFVRSPGWHYTAVTALGAAIALAIGPLRSGILADIGDRRAVIDYTQVQSGIRFYTIWIIVLIVLSLDWRAIRGTVSDRFAVMMLWASLLGAASGGYADRLLAITLPFFIVSISHIRKDLIWIPWISYLAFTALYWFYWLAWL